MLDYNYGSLKGSLIPSDSLQSFPKVLELMGCKHLNFMLVGQVSEYWTKWLYLLLTLNSVFQII